MLSPHHVATSLTIWTCKRQQRHELKRWGVYDLMAELLTIWTCERQQRHELKTWGVYDLMAELQKQKSDEIEHTKHS